MDKIESFGVLLSHRLEARVNSCSDDREEDSTDKTEIEFSINNMLVQSGIEMFQQLYLKRRF